MSAEDRPASLYGSPEEVHVAGFVVRAYPAAVPRVAAALATMPGVQVHAATDEGKLVVTAEADNAATITDTLCRIQTHDGVLSAALVYQHIESTEDMNEEVELEDHATRLR